MMLHATEYKLAIRLVLPCEALPIPCHARRATFLISFQRSWPHAEMHVPGRAEVVPVELLFQRLEILLVLGIVEMVLALQMLHECCDPLHDAAW